MGAKGYAVEKAGKQAGLPAGGRGGDVATRVPRPLRADPLRAVHLGRGDILALQRSAGNAAVSTVLQGVRDDSPTGSRPVAVAAAPGRLAGPVVQRAVGFEWEFGGWQTFGRSWEKEEKKKTPLEKGKVLAHKRGFDVTADDSPTGRKGEMSDLELIVHHVDDRSTHGRSRLERRLKRAAAFVEELKKLARSSEDGKVVSATSFGGSDPNLYIKVGNDDGGQLQATAGLSFAALEEIRSGRTGRALLPKAQSIWLSENEQKRARGEAMMNLKAVGYGFGVTVEDKIWNAALPSVAAFAERYKLTPPAEMGLRALTNLMLTIPVNAYGVEKVDYPKAAAGSLMARTNFAEIMQLLPAEAKSAVHLHGRRWKAMLMQILRAVLGRGRNSISLTDPVFPAPFKYPGVPKVRITFGEWFSGLAQNEPVDKLTTKSYPKRYGAKEAKSLEGLGAFGRQTDPWMIRDEGPRPIFEFRTLVGVATYPDELVAHGLAAWDYIALAHGVESETFHGHGR